MNKAELIEAIAGETGLSKKDAGAALESMIQTISDALKKNDTIQLVGFGTFSVKNRKARKGRNPQTGEEIDIKASNIPHFAPGKALKELVN